MSCRREHFARHVKWTGEPKQTRRAHYKAKSLGQARTPVSVFCILLSYSFIHLYDPSHQCEGALGDDDAVHICLSVCLSVCLFVCLFVAKLAERYACPQRPMLESSNLCSGCGSVQLWTLIRRYATKQCEDRAGRG